MAEQLIAETCRKQGIPRDQLTLHADRGAPMTAQTVAQLLEELGVTKSHSRPHTSDDNPFSEAQFKTLLVQPLTPPSTRAQLPGAVIARATRSFDSGFLTFVSHCY